MIIKNKYFQRIVYFLIILNVFIGFTPDIKADDEHCYCIFTTTDSKVPHSTATWVYDGPCPCNNPDPTLHGTPADYKYTSSTLIIRLLATPKWEEHAKTIKLGNDFHIHISDSKLRSLGFKSIRVLPGIFTVDYRDNQYGTLTLKTVTTPVKVAPVNKISK